MKNTKLLSFIDEVAGGNKSEFAREIGKSRIAVLNWINGKINPEMASLEAIHKRYGSMELTIAELNKRLGFQLDVDKSAITLSGLQHQINLLESRLAELESV